MAIDIAIYLQWGNHYFDNPGMTVQRDILKSANTSGSQINPGKFVSHERFILH